MAQPISQAHARILAYAQAYSEAVERCRRGSAFNAPDWQDAFQTVMRSAGYSEW
jgi:hypothetical protein